MKAMILAAGYGTRMKPLTDSVPKALIQIGSKTLLQIALEKMKTAGISEVVVNVHYLKEQVIKYLERNKMFGMKIHISDEEILLDSGGGIRKASEWLGGTGSFIVHNVDIVSDVDISKLVESHTQKPALATLAVSKRPSDRYLLFSRDGLLAGWENVLTGEKIISRPAIPTERFAFSGIHCCSDSILGKMALETEVFSVIRFYLRMAEDHPIRKFEFSSEHWYDVGKYEEFEKIKNKILSAGLV